MLRVLVLSGGTSDERDVSIRSGKAVATSLESAGHAVRHYDPAQGVENLLKAVQQVDIVFPVLHGTGGEDGQIQTLLEQALVPFVGSGSKASQVCFDKWEYKRHLQDYKINTPQAELITKSSFSKCKLISYPFVLKPHDGGSSIDTYIVRDPHSLEYSDLEKSFTRHETMLVESLVSGTEITVGVLGDQALPVIEIIPPTDKEFDYENKYNGATQELCPPINVSDSVQRDAQALATNIHRLLDCKNYSRTDMIIDQDNKLWVLETNTIPGMTTQSLFPKAAQAAGVSMEQLVVSLVNGALR